MSSIPFSQCLVSSVPFFFSEPNVSCHVSHFSSVSVKYPIFSKNKCFFVCVSTIFFSPVFPVKYHHYPIFSGVSSQISLFLQCLQSNIPFSPVSPVKYTLSPVKYSLSPVSPVKYSLSPVYPVKYPLSPSPFSNVSS